jgi:nitroreductase
VGVRDLRGSAAAAEFFRGNQAALLRDGKESRSPEVRAPLSDPSFDVFYDAPVLVVICATSPDRQAAEDRCLAAQNFMLAAVAEGLATCPIGFARPWLSASATRRKLGIPREWVPVFPIILGYPGEHSADPGRRAPAVLWL